MRVDHSITSLPSRIRRASRLGIAAALLFSLFTLTACQPQSAEEAALEAFAEAFREANQAPDIEAMLALYELEGATDPTTAMLKNALIYELGLPIRNIEFEPLSGAPGEQIAYEHQGVRYGPTLEPSYRMRVRYATEDGFESRFTIGLNDKSAWRIVSSRPVSERQTTP